MFSLQLGTHGLSRLAPACVHASAFVVANPPRTTTHSKRKHNANSWATDKRYATDNGVLEPSASLDTDTLLANITDGVTASLSSKFESFAQRVQKTSDLLEERYEADVDITNRIDRLEAITVCKPSVGSVLSQMISATEDEQPTKKRLGEVCMSQSYHHSEITPRTSQERDSCSSMPETFDIFDCAYTGDFREDRYSTLE